MNPVPPFIRGEDAVTDRARVGGKGAGLAELVRLGLRVPRFVVLPPESDAIEAIDGLKGRLAVRSSAVGEDGAAHSFAGLYESFLGVEGMEATRAAVARCRASGDSERIRAYRALHGLAPTPVAVVIQELVEGEVSGVLFGATPEDPDRVLISAGFGLGEGVVQGRVSCDTYRVGADVDATIVPKETAVRLVGGALAELPVADPGARTLTDEEARALADIARRLEAALGAPQDVEWTIRAGEIWVLQTRPITTPIPRGRRLLWDNSNIIESYHGVTTPLTYSFASSAYAVVYQLFLQVMGVEEAVIRANSSVFPRMIGLVRGRVYYNLNAWYRLITLLPGYRFNKAFMEQMMGVSEVAAEEDAEAASATWQDRLPELPRLLRLGATLFWRLGRLDRDIAGFRAHFDAVYARHRSRDLAGLAAEELVEVYESLERDLLWAWSVPIVNDFFTMIFYGTLRKLSGAWVPDAGQLHNELLAGEGGIESVAPMHEAIRIATIVREDPALSAAFAGEAPLSALSDPRFREAWEGWMARFGDRCVNELKLETPSLRQDPSFLVTAVRNYLRSPPELGGDAGLRAAAEARAFAPLRGPRRRIFRAVLGQARARVRDRENLRFLRTRIFGLARDIFRALGARMVEAGALDEAADVFWLTVPETLGWVRGTAPSVAFRATIQVRREEFADYEAAPPAARFHTRGAVHAHNRFAGRPTATNGELRGTGCCPGIVEGEAAVLADPHQGATLDGQILVAFRTDPGWVPLYPAVSGLLVERGSLLSHSAVVAREIGLPTIIGIPGLTAAVRTGDRLRMDGATGAVERR